MREFFLDGGDGDAVPEMFAVRPSPYSVGLNNFSCNFWQPEDRHSKFWQASSSVPVAGINERPLTMYTLTLSNIVSGFFPCMQKRSWGVGVFMTNDVFSYCQMSFVVQPTE